MRFLTGFTASFLLASTALASVISTTPSSQKVADVAVLEKLILHGEDGQKVEASLDIVGAGLREKFFFNIYVGQLLADRAGEFVREDDKAVDSLMKSEVVGLHMTFLRAMSGDDLSNAFVAGFARNNVDVESSGPKAFLSAVGQLGNFSQQSVLALVGDRRTSEQETLVIETATSSQRITVPNGTVRQIMLLLLGNTSGDSGLTKLKQQIIHFQK